jgi:hypothetical protein
VSATPPREYCFTRLLTNPCNCMDSIFSRHLITPVNCAASVTFTLFVMVHAMDLLPSPRLPLPFPSPSTEHAHHALAGCSAFTGCAAFHQSTSSLLPHISSACTYSRLFRSFHLTKHTHRPSIYFHRAAPSTSNFTNASEYACCAVCGVLIWSVLCNLSLPVKNFFS